MNNKVLCLAALVFNLFGTVCPMERPLQALSVERISSGLFDSEENISEWYESFTKTGHPNHLWSNIVSRYIERALQTDQGYRLLMKQTIYSAAKSLEEYKKKNEPRTVLNVDTYLRDQEKLGLCPYAKHALIMLNSMKNCPLLADKANFQPLTMLFMVELKPEHEVARACIMGFLAPISIFESLDGEVQHAAFQLVVHDESAALKFLECRRRYLAPADTVAGLTQHRALLGLIQSLTHWIVWFERYQIIRKYTPPLRIQFVQEVSTLGVIPLVTKFIAKGDWRGFQEFVPRDQRIKIYERRNAPHWPRVNGIQFIAASGYSAFLKNILNDYKLLWEQALSLVSNAIENGQYEILKVLLDDEHIRNLWTTTSVNQGPEFILQTVPLEALPKACSKGYLPVVRLFTDRLLHGDAFDGIFLLCLNAAIEADKHEVVKFFLTQKRGHVLAQLRKTPLNLQARGKSPAIIEMQFDALCEARVPRDVLDRVIQDAVRVNPSLAGSLLEKRDKIEPLSSTDILQFLKLYIGDGLPFDELLNRLRFLTNNDHLLRSLIERLPAGPESLEVLERIIRLLYDNPIAQLVIDKVLSISPSRETFMRLYSILYLRSTQNFRYFLRSHAAAYMTTEEDWLNLLLPLDDGNVHAIGVVLSSLPLSVQAVQFLKRHFIEALTNEQFAAAELFLQKILDAQPLSKDTFDELKRLPLTRRMAVAVSCRGVPHFGTLGEWADMAREMASEIQSGAIQPIHIEPVHFDDESFKRLTQIAVVALYNFEEAPEVSRNILRVMTSCVPAERAKAFLDILYEFGIKKGVPVWPEFEIGESRVPQDEQLSREVVLDLLKYLIENNRQEELFHVLSRRSKQITTYQWGVLGCIINACAQGNSQLVQLLLQFMPDDPQCLGIYFLMLQASIATDNDDLFESILKKYSSIQEVPLALLQRMFRLAATCNARRITISLLMYTRVLARTQPGLWNDVCAALLLSDWFVQLDQFIGEMPPQFRVLLLTQTIEARNYYLLSHLLYSPECIEVVKKNQAPFLWIAVNALAEVHFISLLRAYGAADSAGPDGRTAFELAKSKSLHDHMHELLHDEDRSSEMPPAKRFKSESDDESSDSPSF